MPAGHKKGACFLTCPLNGSEAFALPNPTQNEQHTDPHTDMPFYLTQACLALRRDRRGLDEYTSMSIHCRFIPGRISDSCKVSELQELTLGKRLVFIFRALGPGSHPSCSATGPGSFSLCQLVPRLRKPRNAPVNYAAKIQLNFQTKYDFRLFHIISCIFCYFWLYLDVNY